MLYRTLKRMIERGQAEGEYQELLAMLGKQGGVTAPNSNFHER